MRMIRLVKGSRLFAVALLMVVLALSSTQSVYAWYPAVRMTVNAGVSAYPSVACSASGQYVYLVWQDSTTGNYEIYFKRSTDYGANWFATVITVTAGVSGYPKVACSASGRYVYLVWQDSTTGNYEIYFKRSTDYGARWSAAIRMTVNAGASMYPSVACSSTGAYVYLAWCDSTPGNYEIYLRRSSNFGAGWLPLQKTTNAGASMYPSVACSSTGQYVYLVWQDTTYGNIEIFFNRSNNFGANFVFVKITANAGASMYPSVACRASGQYVYLVWQDTTPGNSEIYFRRSINYGVSWAAAVRMTVTSGVSAYPRVACSSTGVRVDLVWQDNTPGNYEIYFKRSNNYGL